jgi:hypothetical protein
MFFGIYSRSAPVRFPHCHRQINQAPIAVLFNRRDWDDGLRAMLADDVRLIQSSYPLRAGAADVGITSATVSQPVTSSHSSNMHQLSSRPQKSSLRRVLL